ncbi:MAG: hypothetical protein UHX00_03125 [Caryophanon sp.]|nr:hypothetical protein [Caryophanon sp.]
MKRLALALPLLLLAGCTEETKVENDEAVTKTAEEEAAVTEETPTDIVIEVPTEQQAEAQQEVTKPLQFEEQATTTDAGKHYVDMVAQMSTPNITSYVGQLAVSEEMQWEEMGHPMTQFVTLGATVTSQNGDVQKRLMSGDYIQETNDLRENEKITAYEELSDEYAAYFNEGTMWYRTDPTTMKEQVAVGFYIESIDMLLSHFEQSANRLTTVSQTAEAATYVLTLSSEEAAPIVKKLLQKDDYSVLAPFSDIDNTIAFTIAKGDKPVLQQLAITMNATTATGVLKHESSMTFVNINEPVNIDRPAGIDSAEVFQAY